METWDDPDLNAEDRARIDGDVVTITADLRQALRDRNKRATGYWHLFCYLFFVVFYMAVVWIQADVENAYRVTSSVQRVLLPRDDDGEVVTRMTSPTQILDWLVGSAFPVWTNEVCGDGTCAPPFEYPAYGRFGCQADCGVAHNLVTVLLQVRADFRDDLYSPRALMTAAKWNLCRRDQEAYRAGYPDVCWLEKDRTFTKFKENHLETVNVPKGSQWIVKITGDYMGRVAGNVFLSENGALPWVGTVPDWKSCDRNIMSTRRAVDIASGRRRSLLEEVTEELEAHEAILRKHHPTGAAELTEGSLEELTARLLSRRDVEVLAAAEEDARLNATRGNPNRIDGRLLGQRSAAAPKHRVEHYLRVASKRAAVSGEGIESPGEEARAAAAAPAPAVAPDVHATLHTSSAARERGLGPRRRLLLAHRLREAEAARGDASASGRARGGRRRLASHNAAPGPVTPAPYVSQWSAFPPEVDPKLEPRPSSAFFRAVGGGNVSVDAADDEARAPTAASSLRATFAGDEVWSFSTALTFEAWVMPADSDLTDDTRPETLAWFGDVDSYGWGIQLWPGGFCPTETTETTEPTRRRKLLDHVECLPHEVNASYPGGCNYGAPLPEPPPTPEHLQDAVVFVMNGHVACADLPSSNVSLERGDWNHVRVTAGPSDETLGVGEGNPMIVKFYVMGEEAGRFSSADEFWIDVGNGVGETNLTLGSRAGAMPFTGWIDNVQLLDVVPPAWYVDNARNALYDFDVFPVELEHNIIARYDFDGLEATDKGPGYFEYGHNMTATTYVDEDHVGPFSEEYYFEAPMVYFDGDTQYLVTARDPKLEPSDYLSFEAWINPWGYSQMDRPIIAMGDLGWSVWLMCAGHSGAGEMCCGRGRHGSHALAFMSKHGADADVCDEAPSRGNVHPGVWNHVAVTVDNVLKNVTFYVNGTSVGSVVSHAVGLNPVFGDLTIGSWRPASDPPFNFSMFEGFIDEVRVYNAVLQPETIATFMRMTDVAGMHPNRDDMILYYTFASGGGEGGLLRDRGVVAPHISAAAQSNSDGYYVTSWVPPHLLGIDRVVLSKGFPRHWDVLGGGARGLNLTDAFASSNDGRRVAVAATNGSVLVFETTGDGAFARLGGAIDVGGDVADIALLFSGDGTRVGVTGTRPARPSPACCAYFYGASPEDAMYEYNLTEPPAPADLCGYCEPGFVCRESVTAIGDESTQTITGTEVDATRRDCVSYNHTRESCMYDWYSFETNGFPCASNDTAVEYPAGYENGHGYIGYAMMYAYDANASDWVEFGSAYEPEGPDEGPVIVGATSHDGYHTALGMPFWNTPGRNSTCATY